MAGADDRKGMKLLERAFAVCYTGKPYRASRLVPELKRAGCREVEVLWDFPSPYKPFLLSKMPHIRALDERPGTWGTSLTQYRAVKTAYELKLPHVFIVEDDCRFLKDMSMVEKAMDGVPDGWDMLMLDHFHARGLRPAVAGWARADVAASTACYIANRRAMERLIDMYESPVNGKYARPLMRICDHWTDVGFLGRDMAIYCAKPNLAIQCRCGDVSNCDETPGLPVAHQFYAVEGVDVGAYQDY